MGPFSLKLSSACYAAVAFASLISAQIPQGAADLESTLHAEGLLAGGTLGGATGNILDRRQDAGAVGTNQTEMDIWNEETGAACIEHLSNLKGPTNPSGTAICYNLPSLDTTTGRFMADLRLYQVSTPSGEFLGIPPSEIEVGVKYDGASVSPVTQDSAADDGGNASRKRQEGEPKLLQSYMMVGEMDLDRIPEPMTIGAVEALVMPQVTLSARGVSTTVSPNTAAFINGVFSKEVVMSDFGFAQKAVEEITAKLQDGEVAFVLPGVNILIFPIGLIVTSIWLAIGLAFYGFGTYERYAYRDSYRRRKARDVSSGRGRI